jgi:hypothetical protein
VTAWLAGAQRLDGRWEVTCVNGYAKDWMEHRLATMIRRVLTAVLDEPVAQIEFRAPNPGSSCWETTMTLQDWLRNGWLTEHLSSPEEIEDLLLAVQSSRKRNTQRASPSNQPAPRKGYKDGVR